VTGPQEVVAVMRDAYRSRRDQAMAALEGTRLRAFRPNGAFYLWVDVRATGLPAREFALRLLEERAVAVAPGTAFGPAGDGFVRASLASVDGALAEGLARLADFATSL
jgi:aspartate aminotransferase